jgi:molybdopterin molybdotransferase
MGGKQVKPFRDLMPFAEARNTVMENVSPLKSTEKAGIEECLGRVLSQNIIATLSHPPFNRAAMDGYAVRARDTFGASRSEHRVFHILGTEHAGDVSSRRVGANQCLKIATGARMPGGADAVIMVEDAEQEGENIRVSRPVYPKANVSDKGEDIKKGEVILEEGNVLDAAKIGVLASQGMRDIEVYMKPRIAVLPTGEEIAEVGGKLAPGQIYDINSHTISALVRENGGVPFMPGIVPDNLESLKSTISRVGDCDIIVLSGGSSVGERDLLIQVLTDMGEVLFHGVQIKPGKPTVFAMVNGKPVFGMPGYPTSCLLNAYLFLAPAIRKMAHLPPRSERKLKGRLGKAVSGSVGRRQFLTVRMDGDTVIPAFKESGAITSMSQAEGYIEIAQNIDLLEKGEEVEVTLF